MIQYACGVGTGAAAMMALWMAVDNQTYVAIWMTVLAVICGGIATVGPLKAALAEIDDEPPYLGGDGYP